MIIKKLKLKNYRNISKITLSPCENVNIIYGDNAQGKTNIIEAIWLFTGNTSFRSANVSELIEFEKDFSEISLDFEDKQRPQNAKIKLYSKKDIFLNNVKLKKSSELAGNFCSVIFSPDDLELIKGSPKNRRRFLDMSISQIKPQYINYLEQYEKVLEQRNALLKDMLRFPDLRDTIYVWDLQLAKLGTVISIYRKDYVKKLGKIAENIYLKLSSNTEKFKIDYISSVFENLDDLKVYGKEEVDFYFNKLNSSLELDIKRGYTSFGIHRDDLDVFINGISAKSYGSQGQQRSCVLTLKLAEADLIKAIIGESPIILLDDVMSELDIKRQNYILNHVKKRQVFITCCDISNTVNLKEGKIFKIKDGSIISEETIS